MGVAENLRLQKIQMFAHLAACVQACTGVVEVDVPKAVQSLSIRSAQGIELPRRFVFWPRRNEIPFRIRSVASFHHNSCIPLLLTVVRPDVWRSRRPSR